MSISTPGISTPGTELPLAGMTTAHYGQGFTFQMEGRPYNASLDDTHPNMFLVRADILVGALTHPIFIVCENRTDQLAAMNAANLLNSTVQMQVGHNPAGIQFFWIRLATRKYAIRSAA